MPTLFQINVVANWGSTGRIAEEIGLSAIMNGWNSYIAYGRSMNKSRSHLIRIGTKWDFCWHTLQTRLFDRHGLSSKRATRRLVQEIERIKPDIIHLHNIHGYYINYKILFKYLADQNIPVVWTLHDCWNFTGHCSHFISIGCYRWKTGCFSCPLKYGYPNSWIVDRSRRNYEDKKAAFTSISNLVFVPVSVWLGNFLKDTFMKGYPVHRIYNGVDINIFHPIVSKTDTLLPYDNIKKRFIILAVASVWTVSKGYEDIKKLHALLTNDCVIIVVGLNKEQLKDIPVGIIGIERTESVQQLSELYSVADVFINPTYSDSFPTTNIEALACGTPVITYRTGGSVEAVSEDTGLIVAQGDLSGLQKAIYTIKKNGKCFYTKACRSRAVTLFNKNDRYQEYVDLYNQLLDKK
ncbi:glycosyltransferase [Bacteroides salyersiae]|uniref:glycosyltransferase n=2 Tax=Bacteroides TaxID=816 RepID=UPI00221E6A1D|nr:glycosyltransferase [Bacteroides salyersiae]UYU43892.1 glycosyltransferase [Bacteroides salyersiae]